jgi:peptidoglycan glycosyltransferase/penicillin-binding protein 2
MDNRRYQAVFLIFTSVFVLLIFRLFYFQIFTGKTLSRAASVQRMTSLEIEKLRGDIVDKNGIPFTNRNKKVYIALKPLFLREHDDELQAVCEKLGEDFEKVKKEVDTRREPILIETDQDRKNAVVASKFSGVSAINTLGRYDDTSVARHVLGYLNKADQIGQAGIEKYFDDVLEYNRENTIGVITDARNNLVKGLGYRINKAGDEDRKLPVKLTLDYHIQKIVDDVLDKDGIKGAVVVEDVYTGDIVAMSSKPDFDQNRVDKYLSSTGNELFNRAVASYNLGSIFKIIDTAAFLEMDGNADEDYLCRGFISIGEKEFKCSSYAKGGHGFLALEEAFALSCNPYFINISINTGITDILKMARNFGLGSITGLKYQGIAESSGIIPSPGSYYTQGDAANIAIGQGDIMASPVQVADIVATIANGGIKNRINIVDSIIDSDGNRVKSIANREGKRVISKNSADRIKELMEEAIRNGTGSRAQILEEYGGAGGKTGSAETGQFNDSQKVVHAWFGGYFPRYEPRYAIAVFVENGKNGGEVAVPIFSEIAGEIMKKGY